MIVQGNLNTAVRSNIKLCWDKYKMSYESTSFATSDCCNDIRHLYELFRTKG